MKGRFGVRCWVLLRFVVRSLLSREFELRFETYRKCLGLLCAKSEMSYLL